MVPFAAEALTAAEDEFTLRVDRGPVSVLRACISLVNAVLAVWIAVSAVVWLLKSACCAAQIRSGARAA